MTTAWAAVSTHTTVLRPSWILSTIKGKALLHFTSVGTC